jgi:cellulose 1,4-beta-cellobiosidase
MTVDTTSVFTVVTQFLTSDGTSSGTLNEIKRFYVQDGVVIPNSESTVPGITGNSITETYCDATKTVFDSENTWDQHGGFASMTAGFKAGMVLVLSLWDDYDVDMLWLDSDYPTTEAATSPGVARGTCSTTSGVPSQVEAQSPNSYVIYSNIKVGPINSTFTGTTSTGGKSSSTVIHSSTSAPTHSTSSAAGSAPTGTVAEYGQCGGVTYSGPTACQSPWVCTYSNPYYSQCLPA